MIRNFEDIKRTSEDNLTSIEYVNQIEKRANQTHTEATKLKQNYEAEVQDTQREALRAWKNLEIAWGNLALDDDVASCNEYNELKKLSLQVQQFQNCAQLREFIDRVRKLQQEIENESQQLYQRITWAKDSINELETGINKTSQDVREWQCLTPDVNRLTSEVFGVRKNLQPDVLQKLTEHSQVILFLEDVNAKAQEINSEISELKKDWEQITRKMDIISIMREQVVQRLDWQYRDDFREEYRAHLRQAKGQVTLDLTLQNLDGVLNWVNEQSSAARFTQN